jgi:glutamate-1-semialdehyde 2,1-aminomutase
VLLIFDEVVTGFRLAYGGAQAYYGVVPDLVAYGKALGGGYPIGAFGGRAEVMEMVNEHRIGGPDYVWMASTLGGNPISTAAANAALSVLRRPGTYERLHALGRTLRQSITSVLAWRGVTAQVIGDGPLAQMVFTADPIRDYRSTQTGDRELARTLMLALFDRGVFLNPMGTKLYLSVAHDEATCDAFCDRLDDALGAIG